MHDRTRTGNRVGLAVLGVLLLAGGLVLLGGHAGTVVASAPRHRIYPDAARSFVRDQHGWLWPVAVAVSVLIGLVFLRWLLVQPRVDRIRAVAVDTDADAGDDTANGAGRTRLPSRALAEAVEADVESLHGVRRAHVTVSGRADDPTLSLHVITDAEADIPRVREQLEQTVLPDVRTALELPRIEAYVRLDVSRHAGAASRLR